MADNVTSHDGAAASRPARVRQPVVRPRRALAPLPRRCVKYLHATFALDLGDEHWAVPATMSRRGGDGYAYLIRHQDTSWTYGYLWTYPILFTPLRRVHENFVDDRLLGVTGWLAWQGHPAFAMYLPGAERDPLVLDPQGRTGHPRNRRNRLPGLISGLALYREVDQHKGAASAGLPEAIAAILHLEAARNPEAVATETAILALTHPDVAREVAAIQPAWPTTARTAGSLSPTTSR